jgi:Trypsin-like peptidase domain
MNTNVLSRVFHIKYDDSEGTCFTIDVDYRQYIVTAKHVVPNLKTGDYVLFYRNGQWLKTVATLIGHSEAADISVFSITAKLGGLPLEPSTHNIRYGQDLYFLGFPYGIKSEMGAINRDFPVPLVKKAILSAFIQGEGSHVMLLDGNSNPGFSGGPVIFIEDGTRSYKIAGVISGYRYDWADTIIDGTLTPMKSRVNTGIIIAHDISHALGLIRANPVGKSLL